jgi:Tfp pilus assembly protein PilV
VGVVALTQMQVLSIKGTSFEKDTLTAVTLAEQKIEQLKSSPFDAIANSSIVTQGMTISTAVVTTGSTPNRCKSITVTVTWPGQNINLKSVVSEAV